MAGDVFDHLKEPEDGSHWYVGRKNGKTGIYPSNYVEIIRGMIKMYWLLYYSQNSNKKTNQAH